jgi:3-oxoacyl-[acyl-carrier protein] reductase
MDLELSGKVAVVTGTSVGLGREIAKVLAAEGTRTVVVARRANLLATLQDEIERAGGARPLALPLDLYTPDAPARIRDAALSA